MHIATEEGHDHTVECLVKKGANVSIPDKDGVSVHNSKTNSTLYNDLSFILRQLRKSVHLSTPKVFCESIANLLTIQSASMYCSKQEIASL